MGEWPRMRIRDLGELYDGPHATPKRVTEGPYFLNIASLRSGRLDLSQSDHVGAADFKRWTKRVTPREDDLLFSYETRLGEAALMPGGITACLGRRMALLRPRTEIVNPRFLLYYYLSPQFQQTIATNTIHGATVPRIGLATMPEWQVELPGLNEQHAIAEVLGALDDKIAANESVIASSEALGAQMWTKACHTGNEVRLSSLASFVNGRAYTKDATGAGRVVIRIAELNSGISGSTVFNDIEVPDGNVARLGDILFAWSGSLTVVRWYRPEAIVNQHIFKVIPSDERPGWLVYQALQTKLAEFRAIAADKATTMGHIQRKHLDEPVVIPTDEDAKRIGGSMEACWNMALAAELENLSLARTRDELLPILMSGKVTVKDAEKVVSNAV